MFILEEARNSDQLLIGPHIGGGGATYGTLGYHLAQTRRTTNSPNLNSLKRSHIHTVPSNLSELLYHSPHGRFFLTLQMQEIHGQKLHLHLPCSFCLQRATCHYLQTTLYLTPSLLTITHGSPPSSPFAFSLSLEAPIGTIVQDHNRKPMSHFPPRLNGETGQPLGLATNQAKLYHLN